MKLLTKKLLENSQGDYLAQIGLTWQEAKVLRDLVQDDLNLRRLEKRKDLSYQVLRNIIGPLHETTKHLNYSYDKRRQGRYLASQSEELEVDG